MSDIDAAVGAIRAAQYALVAASEHLDTALVALEENPAPQPIPDSPYAHACQDREPRPKPALPVLGPAGAIFVDPTFGTPMGRVTDETMGGSSFRVPSNAHIAGWNADSTKFTVVGQQATKVFMFDAATVQAREFWTLPGRGATYDAPRLEAVRDPRFLGTLTGMIDIRSQCEPCWSRTDPNVLFVVGGPQTRTIQAIVFEGDALAHTIDLLDLDTLGLALDEPRTYVGGLDTSDDAILVFFGGEGQDRHHYVALLPIGGTELVGLLDTHSLGFALHSAAVDRQGVIALYPTNAQPHQTVFVDGATVTPLGMFPGGHDSLGYGWLVNADSGGQEWDAAQWQLRELDALTDPTDLITPVLRPKEVYLSEHSTWNNAVADRLLPVVSSTFRFNNESAAWRAWDDEVIAIETGGGSVVYRFCHHRSDSRDEANSAGTYFWYQPIANVSPDGRWVLFTSNWEKTLGPDPADPGRSRQDVFVAQLHPRR